MVANKRKAAYFRKSLNLLLFITICILLATGFFLAGYGHSDKYKKFIELSKIIPKNYNSSAIRKSVLPLFEKYKYPYDKGGEVIPIDEVPQEIKTLPFFQDYPKGIENWWAEKKGDALEFVIGGGDEFWGIIVCQNEADNSIAKIYGDEVIYWGNGVYFYSNFR